MSKIALVAWMTFKDSIRNKVLFGILLLGCLLFAANIVLAGMFNWEEGKVAVDVGLSVISISGLALIFFNCIQSVAGDIDRRTVYLLLSRPISRAHYILGKFTGLGLVIVCSSVVLALLAVLSVNLSLITIGSYNLPEQYSWSFFFLAVAFITLSLLLMLSISFLWVCLMSHPFTALMLSGMTYFIGQNMEHVKQIVLSNEAFSGISAKMIHFLSWIMPNLSAFNLKAAAAYGLPMSAVSLTWVGIYGASYIGICITLTILLFNRKELA